jgi:hypothetical protein
MQQIAFHAKCLMRLRGAKTEITTRQRHVALQNLMRNTHYLLI